MTAGDLIGITLMGLTMIVIGGAVALFVDESGLAIVGLIIAGIGGLAFLAGLIASAVYAGVRASRRD